MRERPLSPHLGVYRFAYTMATSIFHRITGVALGLGTLLLAWWLIALATGPEAHAFARAVMGSAVGKLVLLGFTWALFFHLCTGIRHLFWDLGKGFDIATVSKTGWTALILSAAFTVAAWILAYMMK